jgi:hypothetical protein
MVFRKNRWGPVFHPISISQSLGLTLSQLSDFGSLKGSIGLNVCTTVILWSLWKLRNKICFQ